jgi:hypothetical protein
LVVRPDGGRRGDEVSAREAVGIGIN